MVEKNIVRLTKEEWIELLETTEGILTDRDIDYLNTEYEDRLIKNGIRELESDLYLFESKLKYLEWFYEDKTDFQVILEKVASKHNDSEHSTISVKEIMPPHIELDNGAVLFDFLKHYSINGITREDR